MLKGFAARHTGGFTPPRTQTHRDGNCAASLADRREISLSRARVLTQFLIHDKHVPLFGFSLLLPMLDPAGTDSGVKAVCRSGRRSAPAPQLHRERRRAPAETIPRCLIPNPPGFVQGVYSILPPSSLFVLIMSVEATDTHTDRDRQTCSEPPPGVQRLPRRDSTCTNPTPTPRLCLVNFKNNPTRFFSSRGRSCVRARCAFVCLLVCGRLQQGSVISAGLLWE